MVEVKPGVQTVCRSAKKWFTMLHDRFAIDSGWSNVGVNQGRDSMVRGDQRLG